MDIDQLIQAVNQTSHNVDMLVGAVNVLLERDRERAEELRQHKLETDQRFLENEQRFLENEQRFLENNQRFLENEQRFNVLLEEVRFLIRRLDQNSP